MSYSERIFSRLIAEFAGTKLTLHSSKILPSLTTPIYTKPDTAHQMRVGDEVVGIVFNGISRAYPTWIMDNYHIVNDTFNDAHLLVVF